MITNRIPISPMGNEVRIVTRFAGNSVSDINGMKTNAPIIIRKTVDVVLIVCRTTMRIDEKLSERMASVTHNVPGSRVSGNCY